MFSTLKNETEKFREYQANLGRQGKPLASTATLTTKIIVYNPSNKSPALRWEITKFAMRLIWSPAASHSVKVGAALTLLSAHAENPGAMIRSLVNDPDIEVVITDISEFDHGVPRLERRGEKAEQQMDSYRRILDRAPQENLFYNPEVDDLEILDSGTFLFAIATVLAQVWILVAKAVTAPDTAEESENKRWAKYVQQKRVNPDYLVSNRWITAMRSLISIDLSVRKYMVEILIEVKKSGVARGRLNEMIADIGNYIEETGMAGFFLTIKYGLEMKFPVIVINEFQADLLTLQTLMRTYMDLGPRAPYMVLLEDSIQTKFAPGNYPLLWSFAMGVGTTLDRSMGALNINRSYLEPIYFKLGQNAARKNAGSIDRKLAEELGLTQEQANEIKEMMQEVTTQRHETNVQAREGKFNVAAGGIESLLTNDDDEITSSRYFSETADSLFNLAGLGRDYDNARTTQRETSRGRTDMSVRDRLLMSLRDEEARKAEAQMLGLMDLGSKRSNTAPNQVADDSVRKQADTSSAGNSFQTVNDLDALNS
ncbi:nucleocapsid protein [Langya virus]|uniref:Nucleocapsid n=1 Tax=Langya virus TaxID=2971765 RepID=A0AAX3C958_9MONO|nr:nucleocapsid protein [Langya virus]UUV47209.1 nucleocapsid protein [Langya virus]UUV47216.1 nucleocapsid protein [Langya virus]UUV47223.1 nucleocapsid protein [Langya virus]UUV47230.1 nucleocapsid protein [Langya virus]